MGEGSTGVQQLSLSQTGKFSLQEYTPAIFVPMWDCSPLFPQHSQMQTGTRDVVTVTGDRRGGILQWQLPAYSRSLCPSSRPLLLSLVC